MTLDLAIVNDDDDKCDFHHIIPFLKSIGVSNFGVSKEVIMF